MMKFLNWIRYLFDEVFPAAIPVADDHTPVDQICVNYRFPPQSGFIQDYQYTEKVALDNWDPGREGKGIFESGYDYEADKQMRTRKGYVI